MADCERVSAKARSWTFLKAAAMRQFHQRAAQSCTMVSPQISAVSVTPENFQTVLTGGRPVGRPNTVVASSRLATAKERRGRASVAGTAGTGGGARWGRRACGRWRGTQQGSGQRSGRVGRTRVGGEPVDYRQPLRMPVCVTDGQRRPHRRVSDSDRACRRRPQGRR